MMRTRGRSRCGVRVALTSSPLVAGDVLDVLAEAAVDVEDERGGGAPRRAATLAGSEVATMTTSAPSRALSGVADEEPVDVGSLLWRWRRLAPTSLAGLTIGS